jgi:hypothetical protein
MLRQVSNQVGRRIELSEQTAYLVSWMVLMTG